MLAGRSVSLLLNDWLHASGVLPLGEEPDNTGPDKVG